ncbi:MAG TPA: DUF554 domain-containing protein [Deltaproteobacteria bacterium]|nr:DUF554 domain-containing protein [Deltaproteobacteria bacterium]HOI07592.1 DUF554 domain-containing protein [Deltaproteobacteria bacterium]
MGRRLEKGGAVITGTLVNSAAVVAGSVFGLFAGRFITEGMRSILMNALGLAVAVIGLKMALSAQDLIPMVACLLLGGITGELMRIEDGIAWIGARLKERFRSESATFVKGFVSATVLYLTGAMMIVGCITEGTTGDGSVLFLKSLLDGVASIALASTLGVGVAFSALSVFVVQGGLTLAASHIGFLQQPSVLAAITATGGMIILGIGINLLELKVIRIGNLIPALVFAALYPMLF